MSIDDEKCMSFDRAFYNYGRFHNNPINKAIHMVFIPVIILTFGVFTCHWSPIVEVNGQPLASGPFGWSVVFSIIYMMVDFKTGLFFYTWTFPGAYICSYTYLATGEIGGYTYWQLNAMLHIFAWIS